MMLQEQLEKKNTTTTPRKVYLNNHLIYLLSVCFLCVVYGPIHGSVMGFRVDIGSERKGRLREKSNWFHWNLLNDHKSAQELHNYSVTTLTGTT